MSQQTIITLIIAYTCVAAFIFTVIITVLSLVGWIRFKTPSQQRTLFTILIVEIVGICVGTFGNFLKFDVSAATEKIKEQAVAESQASDMLLREGKDAFASDPKLSERKFAEAVTLVPTNYKAHLNLGVARLQLEDYASGLIELKIASDLFEKLPKQEQAIGDRVVILSSLIAGYSRTKDFPGVQRTVKSVPIADFGDSFSALYANASDGAFQAGNWSDAVDYSHRARSLAQAFDLFERELITYNTEANALYRIPGSDAEANKLLSEAMAKATNYPMDETSRSMTKGYLLNTMGLFDARDPSSEAQQLAITKFSDVINLVLPLVQLRDDSKATLASAHGNRADAFARLKQYDKATPDRSTAINYFVQLKWKQGVSSQLTEVCRDLLDSGKSSDDAYAAIYAAVQLGGDKPPSDRQEDQAFLARARALVQPGAQASVHQSLSLILQRLTNVPAAMWKTSFGLK